MAMVNQLPIDEKIHIIRVQDKFEKFETKNVSIRLEGITKIRTNPEFEILFIIYYDKMNEYMKVKSITKPSIFMKEKIDHNYKKQKKYVYNFFMKLGIEEIYSLFKNYDEMVNTQNKDEQTVISLLK